MSTDKTLADVQPGGRVRLGDGLRSELLDQAERLERMAAQDRETGESIEQALEAGEEYTPDDAPDVAAGLQHDANRSEEIAALLRKAAAALAARQPAAAVPQDCDACHRTGIRQNDEGRNICCPDCDLGRACAGDTRQRVGEPVAWMTHHEEPMLFPTAAEAAAYCEDDEQPVPLFRSPAQDVDLGPVRDVFRRWHANELNSTDAMLALVEALAVIDSQAVQS